MAVSKRLRYEILRRDNHACRYCGATAPDVPLAVDHVVPVALGGSDEPSNLVTACRPCNAGKSASSPDAPLVADVEADALRWAAAMKRASEVQVASLEDRNLICEWFDQKWSEWTYGAEKQPVPRDGDWRNTIVRFESAGLDLGLVEEAIHIAMGNQRVGFGRTWKYFCGICWRRIEELQHITRSLIDAEEGEGADAS